VGMLGTNREEWSGWFFNNCSRSPKILPHGLLL
jgi:hypothetical protein